MHIELPASDDPVRVIEGDCLDVLRSLPDGCVDAVVTDPPYPCIKREYGYWTEAQWFDLMNPVVEQCRRVLKPTGSAVFVLQPNSERVGRMRTWFWEFMAKCSREWGIVQDVYWWNPAALPCGGATEHELMRPSVKPFAWLGSPDCYRDQSAVLWGESEANAASRAEGRAGLVSHPSNKRSETEQGRMDLHRISAKAATRGGVTPFNLLPFSNTASRGSAGAHGHGAGTPESLARWWVRYICPAGGLVLDPFIGSGTVALAAVAEGRKCIGVERFPKYAEIARERVHKVMGHDGLFAEVA